MQKYNFNDILEKEIIIQNKDNKIMKILLSKIVIPKIQRDYAQGRIGEGEVRKRFLDNIFEILNSSDEKTMEMDFIYGTVDEETKIFFPLDGQQRLTTLFLLYCYIGARELKGDVRDNINNSLQKFTYETRTSSRRFCENLTRVIIDFDSKPSKEITNLPWFYRSYKQDPSIKAMLNMLDAIHEKYGNENRDLFNRLQRLQFYILPLNGFNLTDELYVKMNARGKQLTSFENFKADLINWMKDESNIEKDYFTKKIELKGRSMPYYLSISQKLDATWTQYFWQVTKNYDDNEKDKDGNFVHPDGKIVDPLFLRLFYRYFLNKYILQSSSDSKAMDKEGNYQILYNEMKYQNFEVFKTILSYDIISSFETFMEVLNDNCDTIPSNIQSSWQLEGKIFSFYDKDITLPERVVFLGIILFLEKNDYDPVKFKQWMRVVWNIVENTDIDGAAPMIGAMKLIAELSEKSSNYSNIYKYLSDDNNIIESDSSANAVKEERMKAIFINKNNSWEDIFIDAEKHPFFRGSISFIMTPEMEQDEFRHRKNMAFSIFDNKGINDTYRQNGHILLRALISRYAEYSHIIKKNFTDTDEKQHYLKKLLASDETIKDATREWFSLKNENELNDVLNESVKLDSKINGWDNADNSTIRMKRAHEALYKTPDLQNWMQQEGAFRFDRSYHEHLYVSKPRSWYTWIMLDTYRNEIITNLRDKGFKITDQENEIFPYYWGFKLEVLGKVGNFELKITFKQLNELTIEAKLNNDEWKEIKTYDYVTTDESLLKLLEKEILEPKNLTLLINRV
ncbi:hypothetical protein FACS1894110_13880 [Spirochaetia bacterium]|nr:hypothetical protein FACS1894110_13880 [Spirochaetia bacterium]